MGALGIILKCWGIPEATECRCRNFSAPEDHTWKGGQALVLLTALAVRVSHDGSAPHGTHRRTELEEPENVGLTCSAHLAGW